jgi:hypothetical protein
MATTLTLQNSINFVTPILKGQPLMVSNFEPALSAANMVLGTMLGAPCRWRFNRATASFAISKAAGTDYARNLPKFGFMETQWLKDASGNIHQLGGAVSLAVDGNATRPTSMAAQYDDNNGGITFRMDKTPDRDYTAYLDYQMKATLLTSPASVWGVVPDEFNYIFNWGFLCQMSLLVNDSRFPIFENYFIARLLGAQDGLTDQERNIFVANWMALSATLTRSVGSVNSGLAGRGK